MQCPNCSNEHRHRILSSPCEQCGHVWFDTEDYCRMLGAGVDPLDKVLDIGCGQKGMIGEAYFHERGCSKMYCCDRHTLKRNEYPAHVPLLMNALQLPDVLGPDSLDMAVHCGMLEHVGYAAALDILGVIERLVRPGGRVFMTCSAVLRDIGYKVRREAEDPNWPGGANPYHYYRSWWDGPTLEVLGYTVDIGRMQDGTTFSEEVTAWFDPAGLPPWGLRREAAVDHLRRRRCEVEACEGEPVMWDVQRDAWDKSRPVPACLCWDHSRAGYRTLRPDGTTYLQDPRLTDDYLAPRVAFRRST